jgi:hypothetical protein
MFSRLINTHEGSIGQEEMQVGSNHTHLGDPCLVLTSDPKPRLRWTADLHERFVDAVTQLGGASSKLFLSHAIAFNFCFIFCFVQVLVLLCKTLCFLRLNFVF